MTELEDLSFPAIALYTLFEDGYEADSLHTREVFYQGFPEDDYEDAMDELMKADMYPEAGEPLRYSEPRGVLFSQRSARPIVID
ncbi:hypothetical protein [Streptomyces hyaluromycini]|uniref:hypothetical protein n=1 Tax=Streptomyces hyaluromycini TaxID=1377993 RepID=UPI0011AEB3B9|nr:hypothetical protein [Streptomyces hyaluromycini]